MSTWYSLDLKAHGNPKQLAQILNLEEHEFRGYDVSLSFGANRGPAIDVEAYARKHMGVIFEAQLSIECDFVRRSIFRYFGPTDTFQLVELDKIEFDQYSFNEKLFNEYEREYPEACEKFFSKDNKDSFLRFQDLLFINGKARDVLENYKDYQKLVHKFEEGDIDRDDES